MKQGPDNKTFLLFSFIYLIEDETYVYGIW